MWWSNKVVLFKVFHVYSMMVRTKYKVMIITMVQTELVDDISIMHVWKLKVNLTTSSWLIERPKLHFLFDNISDLKSCKVEKNPKSSYFYSLFSFQNSLCECLFSFIYWHWQIISYPSPRPFSTKLRSKSQFQGYLGCQS